MYVKSFMPVFICSACAFATAPYHGPSEIAEVLRIDAEGVTVRFDLSSLEDDNSGSIIRIPGEGLAAVPGMPDLPAARRMVLVPDLGRIEVEILERECYSLQTGSDIAPFQPLPVRGEPRPPFEVSEEFYCGSSPWPESPVILESVEILRDIRIARVAFLPVSWNPSSNELTITTSVTVRLHTTEDHGENELFRTGNNVTRSFLGMYEQVLGYSVPSGTDTVNGCYLVISTQDGIDTVSDLLDWKNRKGYEVVTGIVPEIGTTASEIDAYIENAFSTWEVPPEYILLVGDADLVPSPVYNGHSADNIYGVIGSGCVPSIRVGRLSGETSLDLQYEAWKIVQHEMYPYQSGESWFQKGISVGHTEFVANSWDYVEYMMAAGMDPVWFCETGGITPTVEALTDTINSGVSIFGLCGHGDVGTVYPPGFGIADVAALENGRRLPWFALVACQVGMFEGNYCFCEALMGEGSIGDPRGAIGAMGPTTNSPYGAADSLVKWIFKGYFQEDIHHMGAVTDWSKNEVYGYFGSSGVDNNHMHMLFGCPEMDIYYDTAPLAAITCVHPDPIVPGPVTISVSSGGSPLEGALVALKVYDAASGSWMESCYSDPAGNVSFTVPDFSAASDVYITATAFNRSPYLYEAVTSVENRSLCALDPPTALNVQPSPCSGALSILCTVPPGIPAVVDIYDLSGRIIRTISVPGDTGSEREIIWNGDSFSGTPVSNGIYYCRLTTGTESCVEPVVMLR